MQWCILYLLLFLTSPSVFLTSHSDIPFCPSQNKRGWGIASTVMKWLFPIPFFHVVQCPLMKRYTSLMKWDNTYLGLQSLQPWSVYGDSNSFLMLNMREEKDCQKVAPFLQNLPTFKKRTHYFWYSKVTGAFPCGLWAQVLLSISLAQLFCMPNPKILSKLVNSAQNEKEITKICNGNL